MTIQITVENASEYGPGTTFEMNYGAYSAPASATVTKIETVPASKWFDAQTRLWVTVTDHDSESHETTVTQIVTTDDASPIGAHLVKAVPLQQANSSPWAA